MSLGWSAHLPRSPLLTSTGMKSAETQYRRNTRGFLSGQLIAHGFGSPAKEHSWSESFRRAERSLLIVQVDSWFYLKGRETERDTEKSSTHCPTPQMLATTRAEPETSYGWKEAHGLTAFLKVHLQIAEWQAEWGFDPKHFRGMSTSLVMVSPAIAQVLSPNYFLTLFKDFDACCCNFCVCCCCCCCFGGEQGRASWIIAKYVSTEWFYFSKYFLSLKTVKKCL